MKSEAIKDFSKGEIFILNYFAEEYPKVMKILREECKMNWQEIVDALTNIPDVLLYQKLRYKDYFFESPYFNGIIA